MACWQQGKLSLHPVSITVLMWMPNQFFLLPTGRCDEYTYHTGRVIKADCLYIQCSYNPVNAKSVLSTANWDMRWINLSYRKSYHLNVGAADFNGAGHLQMTCCIDHFREILIWQGHLPTVDKLYHLCFGRKRKQPTVIIAVLIAEAVVVLCCLW